MDIRIEFENMRITLSVGPEGVTIDAPDLMEQETRQTTLSEAQWAAYATGRQDERFHMRNLYAEARPEGPSLVDILGENNFPPEATFPLFEDLEEMSVDEMNKPPKVDPVTGDIAGWVKTYRSERRKRALEAQPRAVCVSSCCGTEGARTRDGSCRGCR